MKFNWILKRVVFQRERKDEGLVLSYQGDIRVYKGMFVSVRDFVQGSEVISKVLEVVEKLFVLAAFQFPD